MILRNFIVCKKVILNSEYKERDQPKELLSFPQHPLLISHQVLPLYYLMVQASPLPSVLIILSKLSSAASRLVLCLCLVLSKLRLLSLGPTLDLMTKTWPLCTSDKLNLRERVLDEGEKISFIALPGREDHSRLMPLKNCVFQLRRI